MAWWQTLASGAAGGLFTLGGQWIKSIQDQRGAARARSEEYLIEREHRRESFELDVLTRLQDELATLIDETWNVREAGDDAERHYGDASIVWEDDGLMKPYQKAWSAVDRDVHVTVDPAVRGRVAAFLEECKRFYGGGTGGLTAGQYLDASREVHAIVGARIRELYGPPS